MRHGTSSVAIATISTNTPSGDSLLDGLDTRSNDNRGLSKDHHMLTQKATLAAAGVGGWLDIKIGFPLDRLAAPVRRACIVASKTAEGDGITADILPPWEQSASLFNEKQEPHLKPTFLWRCCETSCLDLRTPPCS